MPVRGIRWDCVREAAKDIEIPAYISTLYRNWKGQILAIGKNIRDGAYKFRLSKSAQILLEIEDPVALAAYKELEKRGSLEEPPHLTEDEKKEILKILGDSITRRLTSKECQNLEDKMSKKFPGRKPTKDGKGRVWPKMYHSWTVEQERLHNSVLDEYKDKKFTTNRRPLRPQDAEYHKKKGHHLFLNIYARYIFPSNTFTMPPENIRWIAGEAIVKRLGKKMANQIKNVESYFAELIKKIKGTHRDDGKNIGKEYTTIIRLLNPRDTKYRLYRVTSTEGLIKIQDEVVKCLKALCNLLKEYKSYVNEEDKNVRSIMELEVPKQTEP